MINHCKNRLLTWAYSVFFALSIVVMQLKHQKTKVTSSFGVLIAIHIGIFTKNSNLDMFSSKKREMLRSNGRMGDNLSKRKSPVQNGRVRTYA